MVDTAGGGGSALGHIACDLGAVPAFGAFATFAGALRASALEASAFEFGLQGFGGDF